MGRTGGHARSAGGSYEAPLVLNAQSRLLVVAPHPDDETIGAGELIQQVRAAGGEVRILLLTDGDNNPWPQRWLERRLRIGAAERQRWGRRRREEVAAALGRLGVPAEALHGLGWPDMGVTGRLCDEHEATLDAIAHAVQAAEPNLVVLPALSDRHPDHGACHVLVRLALAELDRQPLQLAFLVHGHDDAQRERITLAAPAQQHRLKLQALEEHRTQTALSGGRMRRLAGRPEIYERVPAWQHGGTERILPWRVPALLRPWLRVTLAAPHEVRSWHWRDAPLSRADDGRYRLQLPDGYAGQGPLFAKLHLQVPSPWIFDHWGWCEL